MFNYYEWKDGENVTYLELFKPDGTSLGELKHAYNRTTKLSLGAVAELSFNLPNVDNIFNIIENADGTLFMLDTPNIDIGKTSITLIGYQVKAIYSNGLEIMYLLPNKTIESDMLKTDITFTCHSREYELSRALLIDYRGVLINNQYTLDGLSLEEALRDILGGTFWNIKFLDEGYNSSDAKCMRRTVEAFNNVSILAAIDSLCNTFGAIPEYDTVNREIYIYRADNKTRYKYNGLYVDANNYLKGAKQSQDLAEIVTRLYGTGNNNLTINGVNPTGVSYIEDLSYFIFPATLNNDKTGLKQSSKYMSDALAYAELIYEDKVANSQENFKNLYNQLDSLNSTKIKYQNELTTLQTELNVINDDIDVRFVGMNTAIESNTEYVAKRIEKDNKEVEVKNKQKQIDDINNQINGVNNQLSNLYNDLKIENNFTDILLKERQNYIYEGIYSNTGISIEQDLYDEMVEYLNKKKEPELIIDIELNSLFSMHSKEAIRDRQKIALGEKIDIYYQFHGMDIDIRAQILELTINEEDNTIEIVISNIHNYKKDAASYLENILQRSITTSTMVENNVIDWNKGKIALDGIDDLYQYGINTSKLQIEGAANNSVKYNDRGLTIINTTEPLRFLRATNGVLALTKDGGRTYSTAITPEGVWAERLIGQMLVGNNLTIVGGNNSELLVSNIASGTYSDKSFTGDTYGNDFGIVLNSDLGNIFITRERGFKITAKDGSNTFVADSNGNMYLKGTIVTNNATITGGSLTIGTKFSVTNDGILSASEVNVTGNINATTLTTSNGTIGGFAIGADRLRSSNGKVGLSSSTYSSDPAFWAGYGDPWEHSNWSEVVPFYVTNEGYLKATNADITGKITANSGTIGGWNIDGVQLQKVIGDRYSFEIRSDRPASEPALLVYDTANSRYNFYVRPDGYLYARNANISGTIYGSGSFSGSINASSGTFKGTITAGSGSKLGGWEVYDDRVEYYNSEGLGFSLFNNGNAGFYTTTGSVIAWNNAFRCKAPNGIAIYNDTAYFGDNTIRAGITLLADSGNLNLAQKSANNSVNIRSYCSPSIRANADARGILLAASNTINFFGMEGIWAEGHGLGNALLKTDAGSASSRSVKENIIEFIEKDYQNALLLLDKMNLYSYDYKYNVYRNSHQYGFIIDELEEIEESKQFFDITQSEASVKDKRIDFSGSMEGEKLIVKQYDSDVLDKYLLTVCKALYQEIQILKQQING